MAVEGVRLFTGLDQALAPIRPQHLEQPVAHTSIRPFVGSDQRLVHETGQTVQRRRCRGIERPGHGEVEPPNADAQAPEQPPLVLRQQLVTPPHSRE